MKGFGILMLALLIGSVVWSGSDGKADVDRRPGGLQQTGSRESSLRRREKRRQVDVVHLAHGRTQYGRAEGF